MKMKKLVTFLTCILLILCMAACSATNSKNDKTSPDTKPEKQSQEDDTSEPDDSVDPTVTSGKKTLVVYYSASGNTESIANYIASATNGDIMELVPADDYTSEDLNYSDDNSRVVYEHDHPEARNIELVKSTVDNWEEYDTVFIGYPTLSKVNFSDIIVIESNVIISHKGGLLNDNSNLRTAERF